MAKNILIVGSGRQGISVAYDILKNSEHNVIMSDVNHEVLDQAMSKISSIVTTTNLCSEVADVKDSNAMLKLLENMDVMVSAVPYEFNLALTELAIKSKTSMVDLGGHTNIVRKQLSKNQEAISAGVTIVPDCGMGPGMNITMAVLATEILDKTDEIYICDGGLPKNPTPPWNYSLFFNIEGLTNEYDEQAYFLKNGEIVEVPCFEGIENVTFDGVGELEAAVTSGGLSTMPWTFKDRLKVLENKTLRYKGHWEWMKAFRELGLFSREALITMVMRLYPEIFIINCLRKN